MVKCNLSCYINPYINFYGPLSNAKDINIERHPKLNRLLNLFGIITIKGKKVSEISIKIIPNTKKKANGFHELESY